MATRFFLPSSGAAAVSPAFDASWEITAGADRVRMPAVASYEPPITALTDMTTGAIPITTSQQILQRQYVSDPIPYPIRFTTSDSIQYVVRGLESVATANAHPAYILRVVSRDGGTARGTLDSRHTTSTEYGTTVATRIFNRALTALTCQAGDRIVFEVGIHAQAPTVGTGTATQRFGNAQGDFFALTAGLTTDLNPWMAITVDLWTPPIGFQQFKSFQVGNGFGVTESIR